MNQSNSQLINLLLKNKKLILLDYKVFLIYLILINIYKIIFLHKYLISIITNYLLAILNL